MDIWALGVLIYEMMFLCTPFKDKTLKQIKKMIKHKLILFPNNVDKKIVEYIYWVCKIDPAKRPSCQELLKHPIFDLIKSNKHIETKLVE